MGKAKRNVTLVLLTAIASGTGAAGNVQAQTQLPGIVVTTPSPVKAAPAAAPPAQAPAAASQPAQPQPDLAGLGLQISPDQNFVATRSSPPSSC